MTASARKLPLVLGLGDSWFDYFALDLFDRLEDETGLEVRSLARAGTRLADMLRDPAQLLALDDLLLQGRRPAAILLSVGGNDVVNEALSGLLHRADPERPDTVRWNAEARRQCVHGRMADQLRALLDTLIRLCERHSIQPPLLLHGYDHPVPDGRGPLGTRWDAWLAPAFESCGYGFGPATTGAMRELIDDLNHMQAEVAAGYPGRVHHVRLTGTLSSEPGKYQADWGNELHPSAEGFKKLAKQVLKALEQIKVKPLPPPIYG